MTVGEAKTKFVADYEGRIALQGTRAIKQRTFRQTKKMLGLVLGALDAATPVAAPAAARDRSCLP